MYTNDCNKKNNYVLTSIKVNILIIENILTVILISNYVKLTKDEM